MKKTLKNNKGFTLIELMAVIVILAVLMATVGIAVTKFMNESSAKSFFNSAVSVKNAAQVLCTEDISGTPVTKDKLLEYLSSEKGNTDSIVIDNAANDTVIKITSKTKQRAKAPGVNDSAPPSGNKKLYYNYATSTSGLDINTIEIHYPCN